MTLDTPITSLGRAFSQYSKKLEKLHIFTARDLIYHFPSRYDDYSQVTPIQNIINGQLTTIQGTVTSAKNIYTRNKFQIQRVIVTDSTGSVECVWFNQSYILRTMKEGDRISIAGRVEYAGPKATLHVKEYELLTPEKETVHTARLVPVYPETRGVSSRWIRNRILTLLSEITDILDEYLPKSVITRNKLMSLHTALQTIHFPKSVEESEHARHRFAYEELFLLQLGALLRKSEWSNTKHSTPLLSTDKEKQLKKFYASLPFTLTPAQQRAADEIRVDIAKNTPMNRLLQGDVGSGKTIVAAVGMYIAALNGYQSVLMAPTQILAEQHYQTLSKLFSSLNLTVTLVTGTSTGSKKNKNESSESVPDIVIGTHALIEKKIQFERLGLVVVDEQHRFGVQQRALLHDKGANPHYLSMTATPIPRTIFLTMYGDLELSVLDELPKGRQTIKTWLVPNFKRQNAYEWIEKNIRETNADGTVNQAFIVCPFIEESESMQTVRAAVKEYEHLQKNVFPQLKLGMLHGKMKASEKNAILESFQKGALDILVSTPVVEVGIDIPNATIIVIEAAERFGLASLHQLRGRVGRNNKQSYCLLFTESESEKTTQRLRSLENHHTGAALAEIDLKMRGAGDMFGTQQHGSRMLKVASFSDSNLIHTTQQDAKLIFPSLAKYPILQETLKSTIIHTRVNPD